MDWTAIIIAVITALGSFLGVYFSNRKSAKENAALINYRMDIAEKKTDDIAAETAKYYEKATQIEKTVAIHAEQIKTVSTRVTTLESKLS